MFFEIPLDQGFCTLFTDPRSGERTPTGVVRTGLRPIPHRPRGESGIGARTVFTAISDRVTVGFRVDGGNDESANVTGDRGGRRVRPDPRSPPGGRGRRRPAGAFGGSGQPVPRGVAARRPGTPSPSGGGGCSTFGSGAGNGVMAQEPKDLGPPQLDSVRSVPIGTRTEGSGNRVSVNRCQRRRDRATGVRSETRHRPPRRKARRAM